MNASYTVQLAERRTVYRYIRAPGCAPHLRTLPADQGLPKHTQRYLSWGFRRIAANRFGTQLRRRQHELTRLEQLDQLYLMFRAPQALPTLWDDDRFWGWMQVAGVNPMQLHRVDELDGDWAVTDKHVRLPAGLDLAQLMRSERLYATDFSILRGVHRADRRYMAEPRSLYWLDDTGHLMPLAIQLFAGQDVPVFTPWANRWDWRIARAWVQNASNHTHQAVFHLLETHFVPEVVAVAMHRNLTPSHPVFRLLAPHLEQLLGINVLARSVLLSKGGLVDRAMSAGAQGAHQLCRRGWQSFDLSGRSLENDLRSRGLDRAQALPHMPYRDDARLVHGALDRYTAASVQRAYGSDEGVARDVQLQAWLAELGDPARCAMKGVPNVRSRQDLAGLLSGLIFRCTAQHHAMNLGQYESYGYVPFTPAGMYRPPTLQPGQGSEELFLATLPDVGHCLSQIGSAFLLSRPVDSPMTEFSPDGVTDTVQLRFVEELRRDLLAVSATIEARNQHRYLHYRFMDPANMATCVHI